MSEIFVWNLALPKSKTSSKSVMLHVLFIGSEKGFVESESSLLVEDNLSLSARNVTLEM